jgi:hypothetical protein
MRCSVALNKIPIENNCAEPLGEAVRPDQREVRYSSQQFYKSRVNLPACAPFAPFDRLRGLSRRNPVTEVAELVEAVEVTGELHGEIDT